MGTFGHNKWNLQADVRKSLTHALPMDLDEPAEEDEEEQHVEGEGGNIIGSPGSPSRATMLSDAVADALQKRKSVALDCGPMYARRLGVHPLAQVHRLRKKHQDLASMLEIMRAAARK
jgi:hypothetical protein